MERGLEAPPAAASSASMSASRVTARQRLSAVLAEQREADAAEQERKEKERLQQLEHILALKLSLQSQQQLVQAEAERSNKRRQEQEKRRREERRQLQAQGINADGVFFERAERRRQRLHSEKVRHADEEEARRIEQRLRKEEEERRQRERREEERQRVKEQLRMKVSRNVIEVAASAMAQREERRRQREQQRLRREREEGERKDNILSTITQEDEEDEAATMPTPEETMHAAFLAWREKQTTAPKPGELLYYQQRAHELRLHRVLERQRALHLDHPRAPIMRREYHNAPLLASPPVLLFADYQPPAAMTLTLTITNTSFSFNTIQPMPPAPPCPLSVAFSPPGRLSSGQSFSLQVTWRSEQSEEAEGVLVFLSESGRFEVPWQVRLRKAAVRTETAELSMECVVGESRRQRLRCWNDGATAVRWRCELLSTDGRWREQDAHEEPDRESRDASSPSASSSPPSSLLARPDFPLRLQQEGELAGYSHADVQFHFTPHITSSLRLQFQLTFTPLTAQPPAASLPASPASADMEASAPSSSSLFTFPLTLTCCAHELPLLLSESIVSLNTLIAGKLYRSSLTIRNRSTSPHRFIMRLPPALRGVVAFMPAVAVVQAGGAVEVGVRVRVKRGEEDQLLERVAAMVEEARTGQQAQFTTMQESRRQEALTAAEAENGKRELRSQATTAAGSAVLPRVLHVPLSIEVTGQALPLQWTLMARVTSSLLSFSASCLSFPPTPLRQSAAIPLTITNHSTLLQKLHIALPPFLSCLPSPLLPLLPLRSFTVNILFTPSAAVLHRGRILIRTKLGDDYTLRAEATGLQPAVVLEAGAAASSGSGGSSSVLRLRAVVDGDEETVGFVLRNDGDREQEVEAWLPEAPAGDGGEKGSERSFVTVTPRTFRLKVGERRKVFVTFAPRMAEAEEERERQAVAAASGEGKRAGLAVTTDSPVASRVNGGEVKAAEVKAETKKASKKLSKEEQAKAEEEVRRAEQERKVREEEQRRQREEEDRQREAERVYNSPEARAERERIHPSNPLLPQAVMDWSDDSRGEPWSRHGRHRLHLFSRPVQEDGSGAVSVLYLQLHTALLQPSLLLEPAVLDFGRVPAGETLLRTIRVTNTADVEQRLTVEGLTAGSVFRLLSDATTLAANETQTLQLAFASPPSSARDFALSAHVSSASTRSPFSLRATSFLPSFTLSTARLHLGHCLPLSSTACSLSVTNTATSPLLLTSRIVYPASASASSAPFSVSPASLVIAPAATGQLQLRFRPQEKGRCSARLLLLERESVSLQASCGSFPTAVWLDDAADDDDDDTAASAPDVFSPIEERLPVEERSREANAVAAAATAAAVAADSKASKDKFAKANKSTATAASSAVSQLQCEDSPLLPFKYSLYDTLNAAVRVLTFPTEDKDKSTLNFRILGSGDEKSAPSFDASILIRDVVDNFFSVSTTGNTGAWSFDRRRYTLWRMGEKGVGMLGMLGGDWIQSEGRVAMRSGGQSRVEYFVLRVLVE